LVPTRAKYFISFAVLVAPVAASASQSYTQRCTSWSMGRPTDGGITSTECTCTAWSGIGQAFGCELCSPTGQESDGGYGRVICLRQTQYPISEAATGCSTAGGSAAMGLLAVLGVLLLCRRRK